MEIAKKYTAKLKAMKNEEELEEADIEYSEYTENFVQTLRDQKWKSIPCNLLVGIQNKKKMT